MVLQRTTQTEHSQHHHEINEFLCRNSVALDKSLPQGNISNGNCETRHIRSVTGHKCDQSIESYNEQPSLEQQLMMSNVLSLAHSCTAAKLHTNRHLLPVHPTRRTQQQLGLEIHQQRQFKQLLHLFSFSTTSSQLIQTAWQASHMAIEGNIFLLISTFITVPMSTFTIISVLALEFLLSTFSGCLLNCFAM